LFAIPTVLLKVAQDSVPELDEAFVFRLMSVVGDPELGTGGFAPVASDIVVLANDWPYGRFDWVVGSRKVSGCLAAIPCS